MARIPGSEGFGDVVARPLRFNETQTPRDAFGDGLARTITGIGADLVTQERRAHEEAIATREAADRAQAVGALHQAQDDLQTLGEEFAEGVRTGQRDKTKAGQEWAEAARERITSTLEAVPPSHRTTVQADLDRRVAGMGRAVIGKAVRQRDQADVRGGMGQTLEYAERLYLTDPKAADELVAGTLESMGPFSGLAADQVTKIGQGYRERSRAVKARTLVDGALGNPELLTSAEKVIQGMAEIDPGVRETQLHRIAQNRLLIDQRAEIEAQRRARQAEAALKRAEGVFNASAALADKGLLDPKYADQVLGQLAGTPYQAAFRELVSTQQVTGPLAAQPVPVVRATIDALDAKIAKDGITPALDRQRQRLRRLHDEQVKDYGKDGLRAAQERGLFGDAPLQPVNLNNAAGLAQTLATRVSQADIASSARGAPVSLLTADEAQGLSKVLAALPAGDKAAYLGVFAQIGGPTRLRALAEQLKDKDDGIAVGALLASRAPVGGKNAAELYFRGESALAEKRVSLKQGEYDNTRAQIFKELDGVYRSEEGRRAATEAAAKIWAGLHIDGSNSVRKAVELATGGVTEFRGQKLVKPWGLSDRDFERAVGSVTAADIERQGGASFLLGGATLTAAQLAEKMPRARLRTWGDGTYTVEAAGVSVMRADGSGPLILKLGAP